MKDIQFRSLLIRLRQEHLLYGYDHLTTAQKEEFHQQIQQVDISLIERAKKKVAPSDRTHVTPMPCLELPQIKKEAQRYQKAGLDALANGQVGAVMLSGGMGSRLGCEEPKGTFDIGLTREISVFSLHMDTLKTISNQAGRWVPLFILTSRFNHDYIVDFYKLHHYFGYPSKYIHFFTQETNPCVNFSGKLMLEAPGVLAVSPNGNGGWFGSMLRAGLRETMDAYGLKWLNVFAVDNVLQKIADPLFVGATILSGYSSGAKVEKKAFPNEKVGVICLENEKPTIVEYYEMNPDLAKQKNPNGEITFRFGVILNYLFDISLLEKIDIDQLPLHMVKKKVPYLNEYGVYVEPLVENAYKFETLALDLISCMESCLPFEVEREKEFAPVKNSSGVDSPESARMLLTKNGFIL